MLKGEFGIEKMDQNMTGLNTAVIVRLKELLKSTPDEITVTVIKNFIRLLKAIETQQQLIDGLHRDFSEIYALFVQTILHHGGEVILDARKFDMDMFTNYRIVRSSDEKKGVVELKVMHIMEEVDGNGI